MRILSILMALALLLSAVGTAEAAKAKKTNNQPVTGTVSAINQDGTKEAGTFTITVTAKQKKGAAAPAQAENKTYKFTPATKFETLTGKKKDITTSPAKFSDLAVGNTVTVAGNGETAESVKIAASAKKKKKNK